MLLDIIILFIGPDNNVYVVIGDLRSHRTQAQNIVNGTPVDGTGGTIRITQAVQAVADHPLGSSYPQIVLRLWNPQ